MAHLVKPIAEAPEQWVDARTLAAHLNFGYQTILKMVDEGKIPGKPFRNGKKTFWRFKLSAVDAALTEAPREARQMARKDKHAATLEEIAEVEGTTPSEIQRLLTNAMGKLRRFKLITARQLAEELEHNRSHTHSLTRPRSARK